MKGYVGNIHCFSKILLLKKLQLKGMNSRGALTLHILTITLRRNFQCLPVFLALNS